MKSKQVWRNRSRSLTVCSLLLGAVFSADTAQGQGRVDAHYEALLAGIPIGRGTWTIEIGDDQFSAAATGGTVGLLKSLAGGSGSGSSQGRVVNGTMMSSSYSAMTQNAKKTEEIRIALANGNVRDFSIEPTPQVDPDRVLVTDAHKRNVLDPMTGSFLRVSGNGDPLTPDACRAGVGVFDGRMRYDLKLDFKRMESIKAEKGYHGPAVVCAVYFTPISGYIPDRPVIKYLSGARNIEAWFVPIAGTRYLMPIRVVIPTPLGTGILEATQFVSTAMPPKVAKTQ